jgi:hypothetical protein
MHRAPRTDKNFRIFSPPECFSSGGFVVHEVTLEDAEYVLTSLNDGVRVTSTVSEDGIIVYEFKEVMHRQARLKAAAPPPGREKRGVR